MKNSTTLILKIVLCVIALVVFAGLIWFPQTEGRAANLGLISIYADPFIVYVYLASTPFFYGLFQAFSLLQLIDKNQAFTQAAVNTLKNMKLASLTLIALIIVALAYLRFFVHGEDLAGPTGFGIFISLAFLVIATAADLFQKLFQNAVDIKSENDLTV